MLLESRVLASSRRLFTPAIDRIDFHGLPPSLDRELDAPVVVSESTWVAVQHRVSGRFLGSVSIDL
jgi:hypothetical protein